jgi:hypothetical protein
VAIADTVFIGRQLRHPSLLAGCLALPASLYNVSESVAIGLLGQPKIGCRHVYPFGFKGLVAFADRLRLQFKGYLAIPLGGGHARTLCKKTHCNPRARPGVPNENEEFACPHAALPICISAFTNTEARIGFSLLKRVRVGGPNVRRARPPREYRRGVGPRRTRLPW